LIANGRTGVYYKGISRPLKNAIPELTEGAVDVKDEKGLEIFYAINITTAIRLTPSYQHV
jgi:hypothetical protein